jgi:hypothetical protein
VDKTEQTPESSRLERIMEELDKQPRTAFKREPGEKCSYELQPSDGIGRLI